MWDITYHLVWHAEWLAVTPNVTLAKRIVRFRQRGRRESIPTAFVGVIHERVVGMACLVACDIESQTAEYYWDTLGFQIASYWDGEHASLTTTPTPVFGIVSRDAIQVFFNRADQSAIRTGRAEGAYDMYFRVTGLDALAAELRTRRADIIDGPEDRVYGQRELVVRDCNGLVLAFGEDISRPAA